MPSQKRFMQLKFISSIYNKSLEEIELVMGPETLTMLMRRIGENTAEDYIKLIKGKFNSLNDLVEVIVSDVLTPVIGKGKASSNAAENKVLITLNACPYKNAGFKINKMPFFCHYTEGLIFHLIELAFPEKKVEITPKSTIAGGAPSCVFEITIQ